MRLFRDTEQKKEFFCFVIIAVLACGLAYVLGGALFSVLVASVCLALLGVNRFFAKRRQKKIEELALQVSEVVHSKEKNSIAGEAEGELAALQAEVAKMALCLRDTQAQLMQEKLRLPNALADITHQIRGPLTTVNLLMSMLSATGLSEQRRIELLRKLAVVLKRIEQLILLQMKLTKLELNAVEFDLQKVSVQAILEKAAEPLSAALAGKNIELTLKGEGTLECDSGWTCEAATAILKNSLEHTPAGGHIQVTTLENDRYTEILVQDDGTGISQTDMPHIFERFYKGSSAGEGNFGLGLTLAQMIVSGQRGMLQVENNPVGGTIVTIRFYKGAV